MLRSAIIELDKKIDSFARASKRDYTLILVSHSPDEEIYISENGISSPVDQIDGPEYILAKTMKKRKEG